MLHGQWLRGKHFHSSQQRVCRAYSVFRLMCMSGKPAKFGCIACEQPLTSHASHGRGFKLKTGCTLRGFLCMDLLSAANPLLNRGWFGITRPPSESLLKEAAIALLSCALQECRYQQYEGSWHV